MDSHRFLPYFPRFKFCQALARMQGRLCDGFLDPPPATPELAIYSQEEQRSAAAALTFDSPDIRFYLAPAYENNAWRLPDPWFLPAAQVTVRNVSDKARAINALVDLFLMTRPGIGFPQTLIATHQINIDPHQALTLPFTMPESDIRNAGSLLLPLAVSIRHPYDKRLINNQGQYAVQTVLLNRNEQIAIPLWIGNSASRRRTIRLTVLPNAMNAAVEPFYDLDPSAFVNTPVTVQAPGNAPAEMAVTVIATDAHDVLVGGMTFNIYVS